ncbi:MAG: Asparagine synthetase [glutamine-hydrolyzing] (EC [uncultured Sulfurovum sp.]|uniref:asparagine synthase (glutamine-hydrolyzing) n=1 Tax=uncultured Sulfurovum sp. TaxID=269237 RepID=A0A6S6RST5_9BACT|nr:MAG: Asparagine synthetase [glutamine-hydrolyzing] (EC [uncultured Sulfurovum sp.]
MISKYSLNNPSITIRSDLAAQFPVYIYLSSDKKHLLYGTSIKVLLEHPEVITPLQVRDESISFLLQSGIVPLPHTVYENIFIVGIGDIAKVESKNNTIELSFSHKFPFKNEERKKEMDIDEKYILGLLTKATLSTLDIQQDSYLFHSAGKDSNMIALALAEAGYQNNITCITHQSNNENDESEISEKIAKKLGFKHQKLYIPKKILPQHIQSIHSYFENIPLPSIDNVTLAYPIYETQIEFKHSNIIDGSGNDVYIGHIPSQAEYRHQKFFSNLHQFRKITDTLSSTNKLRNITLTKSEWAGLSGFSFSDSKKLFSKASSVYPHWKASTQERKDWDYLDIRADTWGSFVESDRVIRKVRNLASLNNANLILPWCDTEVAAYFTKVPEKYLFDRRKLKNKLILRKILKDKIGLDSDKLGKKAFSFDFFSILEVMKEEVTDEIIHSRLWNENTINKLLTKLFKDSHSNKKSRILIQRLYLISTWYNKNKYIKRDN